MMFFGIAQARSMPVDVFPEFSPPQVEIQTPSLGLNSEEVEALVTVPLEQALQGIPGLTIMRSKSVEQLSSIKMIFEPGTDVMEARQWVQERLAIVIPTLPPWSAPPVILPPLSATSRLVKIGLSSNEHSVIDMSMTAYWKIRERLLRVPGVANVAMWGERIAIPQVQVEPALLAENGTSLDEVLQVTSDTLDSGLVQYSDGSTTGRGGWIETANQRIPIRHVLPILSADDLAHIPINGKTKDDGTPLRLADVGNVVVDTWPMIGDAVVNDGEGLLLIVEKFPWGNGLATTHAVEAAIEEMKPGLSGIDIDTTIFRPATFIELSIENLGRAMIIGSILVILVLFLFLWEWRVALISATIIPLSLVATVLILPLFGGQVSTINVMVLAGLVIAIGAVVDDAIVDVENIVRRLRQQRKEGADISTARIVLEASLEVRNAIIYASLIEAVALIPVFFLEGLSGAFFKPLALSYVIAVLVSSLIAMTVTPALSLLLLAKAPLERRESPILPWLHRTYGKLLIVDKPYLGYITMAVLLLAGVGIWPFLGQELLPSFKERDFLMHWLAKPGTSHPEMVRISQAACQELQTIPGVRNCGSHIGQALLMDEVYGIYFGENWVSVDPSVDYDQTLASIQSLVDGYPGLFRDVQTYLKERIREVLTGTSDAVVVRIYGDDLEVLRAKAAEVEAEMLAIDGLIDVHQELLLDIPQIQIQVDLARAQKYGLKPGDVRRAASYLLAGEEAGDLHTANRTFDVNVWSTPENRHSLNSIQDLLIDTPSGKQVRLTEVADVRIVPVANAINREDLSRRIHVEANVASVGPDLGSVVAEVEAALERVDFPLGYHPELLGEFAERQAAQRNLLNVAAFAALGILFLLWISFKSWRLAGLAFLTLITTLMGGVVAAYLGGGVLSLGSLVGFLTVLGISARNKILLINHYQHLEQFEGETFGPALVRRGSRERVAPILMTALTTGLALVPLVIAGNLPGHEIEHPMAIVILGGLITSALTNLFVVPSLYLRFGGGSKPQPEMTSTLSSQPAPAAR
jgi:CzcA family heavy metal efflux pump